MKKSGLAAIRILVVRQTPTERTALEQRAAAEGTTISDVVREALDRHLSPRPVFADEVTKRRV